MSAIKRVRILVLGDSGVGKTSFVHLAVNEEPIRSPSWTIGCAVEVKLHEYREGTSEQRTYFLEFWDVGGSSNHRNTRHIFYTPCHGVIMVHDLTNRKSEGNLRKWLDELLTHRAQQQNLSGCGLTSVSIERDDSNSSPDSVASEDFTFGQSGNSLPILMIGTKLDQLDDVKRLTLSNCNDFAAQYGCDQIVLDCTNQRYLAAGSTNAVKLSRFYDRVIEAKYANNKNSFMERFNVNSVSPTLSSNFYLPHQD